MQNKIMALFQLTKQLIKAVVDTNKEVPQCLSDQGNL
jgi:hypothetical protein